MSPLPRCSRLLYSSVAVCCQLALPFAAVAVPIAANSTNFTSDVFFPASATDLVNQGQPSFLSEVSVGHTSFAGSTTANLNNGTVGASVTNADLAFDLDGTWTTTFNLDLTSAIVGYDIAQIQSFAGWHAGADYGQQIEVLLSKVNDATFTSLGIFTNNPVPAGPLVSTLITITDNAGLLGTNIDAIRVNFTDPGAPSGPGGMREFDVIGNAIPVPEPTTGLLLGFGVAVMAIKVRRRRVVG